MNAAPAESRSADSLRRILDGVRRLWNADVTGRAREHRRALALLGSHQVAQQKLFAHDLAAERSLRERAETAESELRHMLEFKDAAIQEANHRVKNTLQAAASLLSLHAHATTSAEARSVLQQSYDRLYVLARTHELLSVNADTSQAILMPTLLQAVGDSLRQSFAETSSRVRLQITSEPLVLPADDATSLALLANEVLTNAYKHAFPGTGCGEVTVDLRRTPENEVVLQIADSGVGIHHGSRENGLGLKLIRTFAAQLRGTLNIADGAGAMGTTVTLTTRPNARLQSNDSDARLGGGPPGSKRSDSFLTTA